MKLSPEGKVTVAIGLALVSVVALGVLQSRTVLRLARYSRSVSHTQDILLEFQSTRRLMNSAEALAQSFLITGDASHLSRFGDATTDLAESLQRLRQLTADNPAQQASLDVLDPLMNRGLLDLQKAIDARKQARLPADALLPLEAPLREDLDRARAVINEMESREAGLLRLRSETGLQANQRANRMVWLGSILAFLFIAASGLALRSDMRQRHRSEEKFRGLLESAPDAVVIVDREGRIVLVNTQAERLFGYNRGELLGHPVEMLMPERFRGGHRGHRSGFVAAPRTREMGPALELKALRRDGTEFPVEISLSPMQAKGEVLFSSAVRDVSERRNREEEVRQLSAHLLSVQEEERRRIAREFHDSVGQQLGALKMGLDVLSSRPSLAEDSRGREQIDEMTGLVGEAIGEIRTISHLLYPPLLEELGLRSAILDYLEGFDRRSGIRTTIDIAQDFGRMPREVELALFRVLQESLSNVHRHSGSPTAHVQLLRRDGAVELEVNDCGKGMLPARMEESGRNKFGKLGVGLRGMKERMRQLGGTLQVFSSDQGTTVIVRLPVSAVTSGEEPAQADPPV
jgi:PAS domain S-box-containing protein